MTGGIQQCDRIVWIGNPRWWTFNETRWHYQIVQSNLNEKLYKNTYFNKYSIRIRGEITQEFLFIKRIYGHRVKNNIEGNMVCQSLRWFYIRIWQCDAQCYVLSYYATFEEKLTLYLARFLCSFLTLPSRRGWCDFDIRHYLFLFAIIVEFFDSHLSN